MLQDADGPLMRTMRTKHSGYSSPGYALLLFFNAHIIFLPQEQKVSNIFDVGTAHDV